MKQVSLPHFNVIIATDTNGGFSYKNRLPWKFSKDMHFYNTITSSNINLVPNILIMGRKTWESMNCTVPKNRIAFVISNDFDNYNKIYENKKNVAFFPSFNEALLNTIQYKDSIVWVIGGHQIYDEALKHPNCLSIYYTLIVGTFKTDRNIDLNAYNIQWTNVHREIDENNIDQLNYILYFKKGIIMKTRMQ